MERIPTLSNTHARVREGDKGTIDRNACQCVPPAPGYILSITPLASDRPVAIRLRKLLKDILRQQQFKCTEIRHMPGQEARSELEPTTTPAEHPTREKGKCAPAKGIVASEKKRRSTNRVTVYGLLLLMALCGAKVAVHRANAATEGSGNLGDLQTLVAKLPSTIGFGFGCPRQTPLVDAFAFGDGNAFRLADRPTLVFHLSEAEQHGGDDLSARAAYVDRLAGDDHADAALSPIGDEVHAVDHRAADSVERKHNYGLHLPSGNGSLDAAKPVAVQRCAALLVSNPLNGFRAQAALFHPALKLLRLAGKVLILGRHAGIDDGGFHVHEHNPYIGMCQVGFTQKGRLFNCVCSLQSRAAAATPYLSVKEF
jgi:hypothetical protein